MFVVNIVFLFEYLHAIKKFSYRPSLEVASTTSATFSSCDNLWFITLTFVLDVESVKMSQCARYLGQRSCSSKVIVGIHRQTHTHLTVCSTWITKVVGR